MSGKRYVFRGDNGWNDLLHVKHNQQVTIIPEQAEPAPLALDVPATSNPFDTGIKVSSGQTLRLLGKGRWQGVDDGNSTSCCAFNYSWPDVYPVPDGVIVKRKPLNGGKIPLTKKPGQPIKSVEDWDDIWINQYMPYGCSPISVSIDYQRYTRNSGGVSISWLDSQGEWRTGTRLGYRFERPERRTLTWNNLDREVTYGLGFFVRSRQMAVWRTWSTTDGESCNIPIDANLGLDTLVGPEGEPGSSAPSGFKLTAAEKYALLYRIGTSGNWTKVGASTTLTPQTSGRLYLAMNDNDYSDNAGHLQVYVDVIGRPSGNCDDRIDSSKPPSTFLYQLPQVDGTQYEITGQQVTFIVPDPSPNPSTALQITRNGCDTSHYAVRVIVDAPDEATNRNQACDDCDDGVNAAGQPCS